jgi:hypothetical protein
MSVLTQLLFSTVVLVVAAQGSLLGIQLPRKSSLNSAIIYAANYGSDLRWLPSLR